MQQIRAKGKIFRFLKWFALKPKLMKWRGSKKRRSVSAEAIARHGASVAITEADTRFDA